jgi:hypothetical protein
MVDRRLGCRLSLLGSVLEACYAGSLDWESLVKLGQGAFFLRGLSLVAPKVQGFFSPLVGTSDRFRFWIGGWHHWL